MAEITLNGQPVLELDLHLPLNGAWSAELQVADDAELTSGDEVTLALPELELTGRVVRAGLAAERLRVRLTGGATDWGAAQEVKHYRNTTAEPEAWLSWRPRPPSWSRVVPRAMIKSGTCCTPSGRRPGARSGCATTRKPGPRCAVAWSA
jgi:hypothetical protein